MPLIPLRRSLRCELLEDRLTPAAAGDLDPTFGFGGRAPFPPELLLPNGTAGISGVAVSPDGRIVLAGDFLSPPSDRLLVIRYTADGRLDPTFGSGGWAMYPLNPSITAVTVQTDGRIVLAGVAAGADADFAAIRLNPDGSLDPTFGTGGVVAVPFDAGGGQADRAFAVGIDPAGRVVLAGTAGESSPIPGTIPADTGSGDFAVARLTSDGKLDPTFGTGGKVTVPFPVGAFNGAQARALAFQPDGRIVLAGVATAGVYPGTMGARTVTYPSFDFAAVRLTADGQLDTGFGDGGRVRVPFDLGGSDSDEADAVGVRPDGRIVLAGAVATSADPGVWAVAVRLTPDGRLDPTFDSDGKAGVPGPAGSAAVLPDGGTVFVGNNELIRLTADGQLDPAFGIGGRAAQGSGPMAVQPDGDIVVARHGEVDRVLGSPSPLPVVALPGSVLAGGPADGTARLLTSTGKPLSPSELVTFFPGSGVTVRTAAADFNGDGVPDLVGAAGPGGGPRVLVLDGRTRAVLADFMAFEPSFTGGVFVATGDVTGDGRPDLVAAPDQGGGPVVAVFDGVKLMSGAGAGAQIDRFLGIDDPAFRGGARPAVGDINGDGVGDLVVSAGFQGGPRVAVFNGKDLASGSATPGRLVPDFFAFEPSLRNGAFVAAGDMTGDGKADLAFGGGPGGAPRVRVFDGAGLLAVGSFSNLDAVPTAQVANFFAGDSSLRGGVRVALWDAYGDGKADLVTGSGEGEPSVVRVYLAPTLVYKPPTMVVGPTTPDQTLDPFGATLPNGVFVG